MTTGSRPRPPVLDIATDNETTDMRHPGTHRFLRAFWPLALAQLIGTSVAVAGPPKTAEILGSWTLTGLPSGGDKPLNGEISGITLSADEQLMLVGADEGAKVHILRRTGDGSYALDGDRGFPLADHGEEIDIEAVARDGGRYWVIGSHSAKRKSIKDPATLKKKDKKKRKKGKRLEDNYNHQRLEEAGPEPARDVIYRLSVDDQGKVDPDSVRHGSLRPILDVHPILERFQDIPSKENGIDIEGLAAARGGGNAKSTRLLVGLRGPVLRGSLAVVLVVEASEKPRKDDELALKLEDTRYLMLDGRGIRGLSRIDGPDDDYLVLAGPNGDEPVSYRVYRWNGKDTVPEIDHLDAATNIRPLCEIPPPPTAPAAKAEGIHYLGQKAGQVQLVVVYDSAKNGGATRFSCPLDPT